MCCAVAFLALLGPRAAILIWAVLEPARWSTAFDTFLWPFLGFLFLPWTTLAFVLVVPFGIDGFDWVWLGLGLLADVVSWSGGGYTNRARFTSSAA